MQRPAVVAPGIERFATATPTLPPATHTNSYALGERDVLLVEPAPSDDGERARWIEWARGLASSGRRLVAIVLTHHHADHVGGAELFARELGLPLWAHRATRERLAHLPIARELVDGEMITLEGPLPMRLEVLHTPGHAPGHVCLWDAALRAVVVGDMVASVGTILIEPIDGDMVAYLAQLERLAALDALLALPAHGEPIHEPSVLFRGYIRHRLLREAKIAAALESAGPSGATATELVPIAYADTDPALHPIAALSLAAHLVKLVRDGRARQDANRFWWVRA